MTRILIVEDEGIIARDIQRQLLDLGYDPVDVAVDGEEAVDSARQHRPQLVLMDIHLAGTMDGIEAATIIRRELEIPCVFLTAYATTEVVERAKQADPSGYIIKPFDAQILRTTIEIALNKDRLNRELRASEARFKAVVMSAHDAVVTADVTGTIVDWSPAAARMLGYDAAEIVGQPMSLLLPADINRRAFARPDSEPFDTICELTLQTREGQHLDAEVSVARWSQGEETFVTSFIRDISERKAAAAEVLRSRALLAEAERIAQIGSWEHDLRTGLGSWSEESYAIMGVEPGTQVTYGLFLDCVEPDDRGTIDAMFAESIRRATPVEVEFRVPMPSGKSKHVRGRCQVFYGDNGTPTRAAGTLQDVTSQWQSDELLRLQSAALNSSPSGVIITDRDGTIQWVNPAFTTVTGYSLEEATGKKPGALLKSGTHDAAFYHDMWSTIVSGEIWTGELTNRRKDGSLHLEEQSITPVRRADGVITHFVGVKRDLTEQKRLEQQFLHAQKMEVIGRLAGGVAHDFNNLLTIINGTCELALMELPVGHPMRAEFEEIQGAGDRAARLTRQLLAFSRKQMLAPAVVDVAQHALHSAKMLRRLIGEDITLTIKAAPETPQTVFVDPSQLEQVMLNLAVNARDAMPDGGTLIIETGIVQFDRQRADQHEGLAPGPYVALSVTDTGCGMSPDVLERIFEPFFTTKGAGKGTGLGLATVYGVVHQSGGTIEVSSTPGQGSCFRVYMPQVASPAPGADAHAPERAQGHETVMLVEDESSLRDMTARMLEASGYRVVTARAAEDALELLQDYPDVAIVITDVVMPGMSGADLAEHISAQRPGLKVLFVSGYTDDKLTRVLSMRGAHFLPKPYTVALLTRKIRQLLDEPAPGAEGHV
ncbi:MAG: PAS domain S-box protein [Vicinamibacterales bacterium]